MSRQKTILVTGVAGFVGGHLAHELHDQGFRVIGTGLETQLGDNLQSFVTEYRGNCDLTDQVSVAKLPLTDIDGVINLAGLAQTGASYGQAEIYMKINVAVQVNIVKELKKLGKTDVRILAISSGAVYDAAQPMPLTEDARLVSKASPYVMSKIAMEQALADYQQAGQDIIIVRPFNHAGPGQAAGFILPDLAAQLTKQTTLTVGNLLSKRDYTDVRDVVKAYTSLVSQDSLNHSLYNICSGQSVSGETILELLSKALGKTNFQLEVDKSRLRPDDPADIVGNNYRIQTDTGWQPTIPFTETIKDFAKWHKARA